MKKLPHYWLVKIDEKFCSSPAAIEWAGRPLGFGGYLCMPNHGSAGYPNGRWVGRMPLGYELISFEEFEHLVLLKKGNAYIKSKWRVFRSTQSAVFNYPEVMMDCESNYKANQWIRDNAESGHYYWTQELQFLQDAE